MDVRRSLGLVATGVAVTVLAAASVGASSAAGLKGEWVSQGPSGKIVLELSPAGAATFRGTYTQTPRGGKAKVSRVVARLENADGAALVTLTFKSDGHSATCGLRGTKLYCQTATGTAVFVRA